MTDGTLNNQGLSDVYVKDKGTATVSNDGNMGKCYYLDGTSYMTLSSNMMEYIKDHPFSYGCWFKTSGLAEGMSMCGILSFTYGCGLFIREDGCLDARLDNGTNSVSINSLSINLFDAKWHHLFCTYDGVNYKIYVDGIVVGNKDMVFKNRYNNIGVIGTETNNYSKYIGKGCICDVRVYDECIPNKMVKLLAQGLYLHYPMNQIDRDRNLLLNTAFTTNNKFILQGTGTEGGFRCPLAVLGKPNDTYTVSLSLRGNANMNCYLIQPEGNLFIQLANKSDLSETDYKHFSLSFTIKSGYTLSHIYICTRYGKSTPGDWFEIKPYSLTLQKGNVFNPVWTPAWEDADSWLDTTEYDTSGYRNNGLSNTPPPLKIPISPRYDGCYEFNGNQHIVFPNPYWDGIKSEVYTLTLNVWVKLYSGCGGYCTIFSSENAPTSGLWIALNTERSGLWAYQGTASPHYHRDYKFLELNTWYMITFTFNNGVSSWFLNGAKIGSDVKWDKEFISAHQYLSLGNSYTGTAWNTIFNGCLSDFRIYSTILDSDDIRELYNTSASITNTGALLLSGELIENT